VDLIMLYRFDLVLLADKITVFIVNKSYDIRYVLLSKRLDYLVYGEVDQYTSS
jgi:hypothetical protein